MSSGFDAGASIARGRLPNEWGGEAGLLANALLRALLQAMNDSEHLLVGEAEITRASGSIGVLGEWKSARQGIVLKPDTYDGEAIFKTPFGRVKRSDFPVGRGIFVQAGKAVTMQMPFVADVQDVQAEAPSTRAAARATAPAGTPATHG